GASRTCPTDVFMSSGTVCRASAGVCDVAETCTGSSATCPTDAFLPSSTVCRASTTACDAAENCTGSSAACPADTYVAGTTVCLVKNLGSNGNELGGTTIAITSLAGGVAAGNTVIVSVAM